MDLRETAVRVRRLRLKRSLQLAAAAAILLALVGCAVAYVLRYPSMMETLFGFNGRSNYDAETVHGIPEPGGERTQLDDALARQYIDPYIFPVESSLHDGESTLTVLSCIADRTSGAVSLYLKLENPPEYEIYNSGELIFPSNDFWYIHPVAVGQENLIGRCFADTTATTDAVLYYVFVFSCEPSCTQLELRIGDLPETVVIPLPEETDMPYITMEGGAIRMTPFGMNLSSGLLNRDDNPSRDEQNRPVRYTPSRREVAIRFKDGSEYLVLSTGHAQREEDYYGCTYAMAQNFALDRYVIVFNRVVDVSEVAVLRINDRIYAP